MRSDATTQKRYKNAGKQIDALSASDWRLHDFRRTGVTTLARLKVSPHVADLILSHKPKTLGAVARIYQRHQFEAEQAEALDLWARHVQATGHARSGENVVPIGHSS
jgi:hypothetical protein